MLRDIGERRILHDIIEKRFPPTANAIVPIGDDGAVVSMPKTGDALVLTTDPCPIPVAWILGERDYYLFGWFSVLINASDLAAMGATPIGVLLAVQAREDMLLEDFNRFLDGAADAATEFSCPVLGGNLKDANDFSCVGTAIGICQKDEILRRSGARAGELVIVVGEMGIFASGVLAKIHDIELSEQEMSQAQRNLMRPKAKVREGRVLASQHIATACIDSSDGLANCFYEIALKSYVDIYLDFDNVPRESIVMTVATKLEIDARKLMLMWGDWQLVCTVPKPQAHILEKYFKDLGAPYSVVGETRDGTGAVLLKDGTLYKKLYRLDNERFSGSSYFTHSIEQSFNLADLPLTE